jgi:LysM repeat protein
VIPVFLSTNYQSIHAQTASALDVVQAVNDLRATYGLAPYEVSGIWMDVAQAQSDYQASIQELTHLRADGTGPGDHSISSENIGGGYAMSADSLISQWTDYWHAFTMIGFSSGLVGVGVALGDNGYYYYTLVVKNTGKLTGLPTGDISVGGGNQNQPGTAITGVNSTAAAVTPLSEYTSTPQEDGSVKHIVVAGETLWSIGQLYDVSEAELVALNYLDPNNPVIYAGQSLIIRSGFTSTPSPTITNTPLPPTRTLRPSRTPQPSHTPASVTPYGTGTVVPLVPNGAISQQNLNKLGIVTVVIAFLGLATILFGRWFNRRGQ